MRPRRVHMDYWWVVGWGDVGWREGEVLLVGVAQRWRSEGEVARCRVGLRWCGVKSVVLLSSGCFRPRALYTPQTKQSVGDRWRVPRAAALEADPRQGPCRAVRSSPPRDRVPPAADSISIFADYCEYCDISLTHSSVPGRKQHHTGRKHIMNYIEHWAGYQAALPTMPTARPPPPRPGAPSTRTTHTRCSSAAHSHPCLACPCSAATADGRTTTAADVPTGLPSGAASRHAPHGHGHGYDGHAPYGHRSCVQDGVCPPGGDSAPRF